MFSRYDDRIIMVNRHDRYKELFQQRGVKYIRQYNTATLRYPTENEIAALDVLGHAWAIGDRYYKLADKHYGDSRFWWVLAWFNQKPTEAHIDLGEVVYVPLPLERVLTFMDT